MWETQAAKPDIIIADLYVYSHSLLGLTFAPGVLSGTSLQKSGFLLQL